tara:strand:- start:4141 stop:4302 length:162 start_codon:yes stop_codon:yes gene_type:complete
MFEKEELALIHKALSELQIRGVDSHVVAGLLNKVATIHQKPENEKPGKVKVEK